MQHTRYTIQTTCIYYVRNNWPHAVELLRNKVLSTSLCDRITSQCALLFKHLMDQSQLCLTSSFLLMLSGWGVLPVSAGLWSIWCQDRWYQRALAELALLTVALLKNSMIMALFQVEGMCLRCQIKHRSLWSGFSGTWTLLPYSRSISICQQSFGFIHFLNNWFAINNAWQILHYRC